MLRERERERVELNGIRCMPSSDPGNQVIMVEKSAGTRTVSSKPPIMILSNTPSLTAMQITNGSVDDEIQECVKFGGGGEGTR